ncbi:protein phosphatase 2C, putative [Plasmodium ovale curtisi]|uniref:protein-serine/threonine phosphatase n=2 Tax=Plasmodium ovale curtisi TaxID=864141 RepID=A0A1A8W4I7_PLAOA|nr:protein phosphatase 2C, putative [Plasmodium ovale curtisi]
MDTHGSVEEHIYMYIYAHTRNGYFSAPEKFPIMQSPQNKIEIESERKSITESECENVDKMEKHYRNCETLDPQNITNACIQMDREILSKRDIHPARNDTLTNSTFANSGSTGDSRAMLIKNDGSFISLSEDHKPYNKTEKERIDKIGGFVENGRILGYIGVSRSFGDKNYKNKSSSPYNPYETMITCIPDIKIFYANPNDILLLGCDGIFEMLSWSDVAKFSYECVNRYALSDAVINILDYALLSGSKDNITIQVIKFFNDKVDTFHFREKLIPGIYIHNDKITKYEFYGSFLNKYHINDRNIINNLMESCTEIKDRYGSMEPFLKKIRENKNTHIMLNRRNNKNIKYLTLPILKEDLITNNIFNKMDQSDFNSMREFFREYDRKVNMSNQIKLAQKRCITSQLNKSIE